MVLSPDELTQVQDAVDLRVGATEAASDQHWVLYCGVLVFFMQAGFAMLCAGCVPSSKTTTRTVSRLGPCG